MRLFYLLTLITISIIVTLSISVFLVIKLTGKTEPPPVIVMPVVNEENCKYENIEKIADKETREEFAGLCLYRMKPFR